MNLQGKKEICWNDYLFTASNLSTITRQWGSSDLKRWISYTMNHSFLKSCIQAVRNTLLINWTHALTAQDFMFYDAHTSFISVPKSNTPDSFATSLAFSRVYIQPWFWAPSYINMSVVYIHIKEISSHTNEKNKPPLRRMQYGVQTFIWRIKEISTVLWCTAKRDCENCTGLVSHELLHRNVAADTGYQRLLSCQVQTPQAPCDLLWLGRYYRVGHFHSSLQKPSTCHEFNRYSSAAAGVLPGSIPWPWALSLVSHPAPAEGSGCRQRWRYAGAAGRRGKGPPAAPDTRQWLRESEKRTAGVRGLPTPLLPKETQGQPQQTPAGSSAFRRWPAPPLPPGPAPLLTRVRSRRALGPSPAPTAPRPHRVPWWWLFLFSAKVNPCFLSCFSNPHLFFITFLLEWWKSSPAGTYVSSRLHLSLAQGKTPKLPRSTATGVVTETGRHAAYQRGVLVTTGERVCRPWWKMSGMFGDMQHSSAAPRLTSWGASQVKPHTWGCKRCLSSRSNKTGD